MFSYLSFSFLLFFSNFPPLEWGFYSHREINKRSIFTLPNEMIGFYKENIEYLTEHAVDPDKRRYIVKNEALRHYIDLDVYGDSSEYKMPRYWKQAVEKYTKDTLEAYGIVPYHVYRVSFRLIDAFKEKDRNRILKISADLGHYIGDANVPLHTTENYNGQLTGQRGIHGLWETRLPELFSGNHQLFSRPTKYIENIQKYIWNSVIHAHHAVDSVLAFEQELTDSYFESKKYTHSTQGTTTKKNYSYEFAEDYHNALDGMVERQMLKSIQTIGDIWYSCWVKAGQPDLSSLRKKRKK